MIGNNHTFASSAQLPFPHRIYGPHMQSPVLFLWQVTPTLHHSPAAHPSSGQAHTAHSETCPRPQLERGSTNCSACLPLTDALLGCGTDQDSDSINPPRRRMARTVTKAAGRSHTTWWRIQSSLLVPFSLVPTQASKQTLFCNNIKTGVQWPLKE